MSVADPFTALAAGNGFPFCIPTSAPNEPEANLLVANLSLEEAMGLYWNTETITLEFSIAVSWTHPDDGSFTHTFVYSKTSEQAFFSPTPRSRICGTEVAFGWFDDEQSSGSHQIVTSADFSLHQRSSTVGGPRNYPWAKIDGEFSFYNRSSRASNNTIVQLNHEAGSSPICYFHQREENLDQIGTELAEFIPNHSMPFRVSLPLSAFLTVHDITVNYLRFTPNFFSYE